jgi:plastocyanin
MNHSLRITSKPIALPACVWFLLAGASAPLRADTWNTVVGAQSADQAKQALAFLPNELWIHAGDGIRWTFAANEIHTVSFLTPGPPAEVRPPLFAPSGAFIGCPGAGATPDGSSFNGSACVSSNPSILGQTYTVQFPAAGNFKLVCLVHVRMTGTVHVLNPSENLPHDQAFYDREAANQQAELLSDAAGLEGRGNAEAQLSSPEGVTAGISAISGNGGGSFMTAVWRFLGGTTVVRVGDTVEWTNRSPSAVHTVTFGVEPANLVPPSPGVIPDPDGARHATISSPNQNVNSGFLIMPNQETVGLPQWPVDITRFRVTFLAPGTFN